MSPASDECEEMMTELEGWMLNEVRRGPAGGRHYVKPTAAQRAEGQLLGNISGHSRPPKRARKLGHIREALRIIRE